MKFFHFTLGELQGVIKGRSMLNPSRQSILALAICLALSSSCAKKDQITPSFEAKSLKAQGIDHLNLSMGLEEEVEGTTTDVERIPVVGGIAGNLVQALANATIERREGLTLELSPQIIELPELRTIDMRFIESIFIESVKIEIPSEVRRDAQFIRQSTSGQSGTAHLLEERLDFISKIEVYLEAVDELDPADRLVSSGELNTRWGNQTLENLSSEAVRVLEFDAKKDEVGCDGGCLNLRPIDRDLSNYLPRYGIFKVHTKILLGAVPEGKLKVKGKINFRININPPF